MKHDSFVSNITEGTFEKIDEANIWTQERNNRGIEETA
jgi:hypothetical protein